MNSAVSLLSFTGAGFVTLLVIVDPFGLVPVYASLTAGMPDSERRTLLLRALFIATIVSLFFLLAGHLLLARLGVSVYAFTISGGILLFITALPMLFGERGSLQATKEDERPPPGEDLAVFPLAIPLLSGPGTMTTLLLLASQSRAAPMQMGLLAADILLVFLVTWMVLGVGRRIIARIGEGGIHVVTKIMGIVLAALAVQFVLNGVTAYYHGLAPR